MGTENGLRIPVNRSEKIRASYVAIASVGENPRPQLDATSPENGLRIPVNRSERLYRRKPQGPLGLQNLTPVSPRRLGA